MLVRTLDFSVDHDSWKEPNIVPDWLQKPDTAGQIKISVIQAMLMLGSITTPSALSAGSPERLWACVRYFSACVPEPSLRIRQPFLTLDPHQRGILSDDFGVAMSTCWIADQLNARDIVDGRFFALNYGLLKKDGTKESPKKNLAKIGRNKCPDFVIEDGEGHFHILECKGTQSAYVRDRQMVTGRAQKKSIRFGKKITGERLVAGLRLRGEGDDKRSHLRIVDPKRDPIVRVSSNSREKADRVIRRLGAARAFNLAGLTDLSSALVWKDDEYGAESKRWMYEAEIKIATEDRIARAKRAMAQLEESLRTTGARRGVLQSLTIALPEFLLQKGDLVNLVKIERGIRPEYLDELRRAGDELGDAAEAGSEQGSRIKVHTDRETMTLNYGGFAWTRFTFDHK